tara:strand:- start:150 stop:737 length:588 start_codon:yes stop_codon:yes gene_type:complete
VKKIVKWSIVGVMIMSGVGLGLSMIPSFLFYSSPVANSDLIVVLAGDHGPRLDYAISLYDQGLSKKMMLTGGPYYDTNDALLMKAYATRRGVLADDIHLETHSKSTYDNANLTLDYILKSHSMASINSVVVVTSGYHSYRSYQVFRSIFPDQIGVYSMPSDGSDRLNWGWWQSPRLIEQYGIEFFKWVFYRFFYL